MSCSDTDDDIGFKQGQLASLKAATISAASLSMIGSLFIIVTYHLIRTHRPLALQLLYWLSISDIFASLTYAIDGLSPDSELMRCSTSTFCGAKAAAVQVFTLAAILWTGAIAANLYLGLLAQSRIARQPEQLLRYVPNHAGWPGAPSGAQRLNASVEAREQQPGSYRT
jgi:hypothetical protein